MKSVPDILTEYCNLLWRLFQIDLDVLSIWWMWAPLCIPALGYAVFMYVKWLILLLPFRALVELIRMIFQKSPSHSLPAAEIKKKCKDVWQSISNKKDKHRNN